MNKILSYIFYGAIAWGVAFLVASVFVAYKVTPEILVQAITTLAVLITVYLLAKSLKLSSRSQALWFGFILTVTGLVLDLLITARYTGMAFFNRADIWISYFLGFLTPQLAVKKKAAAQVQQ